MSLLLSMGGAVLAAAVAAEPQRAPPDSGVIRLARAPVSAPPTPAISNPWTMLDLDFANVRWRFHGYLQYDGAAYDQARAGPPESDFRRGGGLDLGDPLEARQLDDGSYLRRARFGGEGAYGTDIAYRVMFEIGKGDQPEPAIAEVWASYSRFRPYVIQAGAFPQPVNMDGATSSDATLFLERATAADLARGLGAGDGRLGVTLKRLGERSIAAISLTGPVIDSGEDFTPRLAVVARAQRTLSFGVLKEIHVGVNGTYVITPAKTETIDGRTGIPVRFQNTPEVDVDRTPLIDTGVIAATHANVVGLEFSAQRRNLYMQAEAFRFGVERQRATTAGDARFFGYYLQGSWILTGETRRYEQTKGAYTFPTINRPLGAGGWGALELAFRYSRMDLNYRQGEAGAPPPSGGVRGGDQQILGAAVLWYPRPRVRFMLNYLHVIVDRLNPAGPDDPDPFGAPPATPPPGVQIGQTLNIVALRGRYSF